MHKAAPQAQLPGAPDGGASHDAGSPVEYANRAFTATMHLAYAAEKVMRQG
jgi:hypothetical protein